MATFFGKIDPKFEPVPEDKLIASETFLKAAEATVPIFDILGKAFSPVKSDFVGNINKIEKVRTRNPEKFKTFRAMLEEDIVTKNSKHKDSATVALLWLKRGLEFISHYIVNIVEDHKKGDKSENLVAHCKKAYEDTLKKYHGWIVQKVFSVVSHATPWRKDFFKALCYGAEGSDEQVIQDMDEFVTVLQQNTEVLSEMYIEMGLDNDEKV